VIFSTIWGGTELTTTRIIIAGVAEALLLLYFLWAWRLFGR
jgi:hypothetical protein